MNNYNTIFSVIKKHCGAKGVIADNNCFDIICSESKVPLNRMHFYLSGLAEMGFIEYSFSEKFIKLTKSGKLKDKLFLT